MRKLKNKFQTVTDEMMPIGAAKGLMVIAGLSTATLVVSNLLAMKIWSFCSIPVDGGVWLFPILYITGDLLCEIYGKERADEVAYLSAAVGFVTVLLLIFSKALPDHPEADNTAFDLLTDTGSTIMAASIISFLVGQLLNNYAFEQIRHKYAAMNDYCRRAFGSSIPAHAVDALVFETLAFFGRLSLTSFLQQAFFAFIIGIIIEAAFLPVNFWLKIQLSRKLHYWNGHISLE